MRAQITQGLPLSDIVYYQEAKKLCFSINLEQKYYWKLRNLMDLFDAFRERLNVMIDDLHSARNADLGKTEFAVL